SYTTGEYLVTSSMVHTQRGQIPVEAEVEVLRNHGSDQLLVDAKDNILLDVDYLDLQDAFGETFYKVPVMTNRQHFDELTRYYSRRKQWSTYFYLKDNIADLRPRDAATVHKSQGSTYDAVFIDLGNISTCHQP